MRSSDRRVGALGIPRTHQRQPPAAFQRVAVVPVLPEASPRSAQGRAAAVSGIAAQPQPDASDADARVREVRRVVHPGVGKPPTLTTELEELLVVLQGAIELANVERWVLQHGEQAPPAGLNDRLRRNAYEVTVVDRFHRLARRDFERQGYVSIWERPLKTGKRASESGRCVAVPYRPQRGSTA
jgi:hypothetical protein